MPERVVAAFTARWASGGWRIRNLRPLRPVEPVARRPCAPANGDELASGPGDLLGREPRAAVDADELPLRAVRDERDRLAIVIGGSWPIADQHDALAIRNSVQEAVALGNRRVGMGPRVEVGAGPDAFAYVAAGSDYGRQPGHGSEGLEGLTLHDDRLGPVGAVARPPSGHARTVACDV